LPVGVVPRVAVAGYVVAGEAVASYEESAGVVLLSLNGRLKRLG